MGLKVRVKMKDGKMVLEVEGGKIKIKEPQNKTLAPQVYKSPKHPQAIKPELSDEPVLSFPPSDGIIEALWNIYKEKKILRSRLSAQKEIYRNYTEVLDLELEVAKRKKALLKETIEMKWLEDGKYIEMLEQKLSGKDVTPDRETLRETLLELLKEIAEEEA